MNNLMFNEHFNFAATVRSLRGFIAEIMTDLCNLDKKAFSKLSETKEMLEVKFERDSNFRCSTRFLGEKTSIQLHEIRIRGREGSFDSN